MALSAQSHVTFADFPSKPCVTDLLQTSSNGVFGVPLRAPLGSVHSGTKKIVFAVSAKLRKVKKHERPWPEDPDPNVRGGVLSHLSPFKPLKVKPKPVTLDFEKPLMDLQKKIIDVQRMANETGLDFSDQIISLENKYQQALKDLYTHLTPIQRVNIARHPNRPTFLDHVFNITETFVELHGDRAGYDDPAVVTGLGTIYGKPYMFIGHQKGRNTKENIQRNFGMPTPHGYRKALRMMYYADHHGFPIVTFIDTPGAYADLKSEELGQGEAIAYNLRTMFGLKVPIISIVMGEGGSGGALAIGCGNKLLMLENAVFYVASPEACAAILWKSAKASPKAAEKLKITATELSKLQIADGVIPEPLGGAHADPYWTSQQIKIAILEGMDELQKMNVKELLEHRARKFRKLGGFQEGIPQDPLKKVNMKKKERLVVPPIKISDAGLKDEVEKLEKEVLKAMGPSSEKLDLSSISKKMIEKLQIEVDIEYSKALAALGLEEEIKKLREEAIKAKNSMDPALQERIQNLTQQFNQNLPSAPNYDTLKHKLQLLNELTNSQSVSEKSGKISDLKQEINKRFIEVINQPHLKEKIESLKTEIDKSGISEETREKTLLIRNEIEQEFAAALESVGLWVNPPSLVEAKAKLDVFNKQILDIIDDVGKDNMELLKEEVAKAGETPDPESKAKMEALEHEIKRELANALSVPELKQKYEQLKAEVSEAIKYCGGSNGSVKHEGDTLKPDGLKVESQVKNVSSK